MAKKEQAAQKPKAKIQTNQAGMGKKNAATIAVILIIIAAAVAVVFLTQLGSTAYGVSFSTFKANLDAAPRISVLINYANSTQLNYESSCVNYVVEILSNKRSPSTIDFFETNATTCTYAPDGLGHQFTPQNSTELACAAQAAAEPGIVLNYAAVNSSVITAKQMYVYGNAAYFAQCPIAVDLN